MQMFYTLITCRTKEGWTVCRCFIHLLPAGRKKDGLYVDVLYTYYLQDTRRIDCMQMIYTLIICRTQEGLTVCRCFYTLITCRTQEGQTVCRCFIHLLSAGHKKDRLYVDALYTYYLKDKRRIDCMQMFYTLITCRTQEGLTVCRCFIHLLPAGQKKDGLYVDVLYTYYLQDKRRIDCMQMFYTLNTCRTQEVQTVCRCFIHLLPAGQKKDGLYVDVLYTYYLQDTRRMDCMQMLYTLITCGTQEGQTVCRCFIHLLPAGHKKDRLYVDVLYTYYLQDTRRIDCMQMFYTLNICRTQEGLTVCICFIHLLPVGHKKDGLYVDVLYTYYLQDTRRIDCMQMFYTLNICRTQDGWTVCRCFIHLLSVGHKKDGL